MSVVRDILGMILIFLGMLVYIVEIIGVFRFDYVLNRMHAAALGDTLGLLLVVMGTGILFWDIFPILKLVVILACLWLTSPVSSHLLARIEVMTNRHFEKHLSEPISEKGHSLKGDRK